MFENYTKLNYFNFILIKHNYVNVSNYNDIFEQTNYRSHYTTNDTLDSSNLSYFRFVMNVLDAVLKNINKLKYRIRELRAIEFTSTAELNRLNALI